MRLKGVIPPQQVWRSGDFAEMPDSEKIRCINEAFDVILGEASGKEASFRVRERTKVACLCEEANSEEMWEEYSDCGTGFQVSYEKKALFGMGSCEGAVPLIFPVMYEEKRPDMSELAMMIALSDMGFRYLPGDTLIQRCWFASMLMALYVKGRRLFSHEKEWRIVIPDQTVNEISCLYAARFCPVGQIRLGERISPSDEKALRGIAEKLGARIVRYCEWACQ